MFSLGALLFYMAKLCEALVIKSVLTALCVTKLDRIKHVSELLASVHINLFQAGKNMKR